MDRKSFAKQCGRLAYGGAYPDSGSDLLTYNRYLIRQIRSVSL
jgi:hypothetical protein